MKIKSIYIAISIVLFTLNFVSCNEESLYEGPCKVRFVASVQDEVSVTRVTGYTGLTPSPDFSAGLCVSYGETAQSYTMSWDEANQLSANLWLESGDYNFYGYAPQLIDAEFDNSSKRLTLPNISGLTDKDMLVIKPHAAKVTHDMVSQGSMTIPLQMDHLLAKITPCFYINEVYDSIRDIKITKVEFSIPDAATYTVNVDYDASSYTTTWKAGATVDTTVTAFSNTDGTNFLPTAKGDALAVGHCYIVPNQSSANLKMKVTYNVYDKKGTLTRENAVAENQIKNLSQRTFDAGVNYNLKIQIIPTYLYVLSDNDQESVLVINDSYTQSTQL